MSRAEVEEFTDFIACNPQAGDEMQGTGGCRKVRVGGRGKGKSGGFRVITFFTGPDLPIFLITVFGKGETANLTKAERNALSKLAAVLVSEYSVKVTSVEVARKGRS